MKPDPVREYLRAIGRKGGKKGGPARMKKLTREERVALAKRAITTRWAKKKKKGRSR